MFLRDMPKLDELLFAFKTFSAAMLAYYISCWLGLDNPFWSMASAFIVSNPYSGAMRSKAVYRFFGTIVGGSAAVIMVPILVDAPLLLCLAMAFWVGGCLYISLLDRSARAYAFMLAGYTAGIIGFPAVTDPGHVFQIALTRCEEITLGIACTTMIGTLIFPRGLGPVLARRIAAWVQPGVDWACAELAGDSNSRPAQEARRRLAFEATDIGMMVSQLAYDTSNLQGAVQKVNRLRMYVVSLMPILASIGPRVAELHRINGVTPALQNVLNKVEAWVKSGKADGADTLLGDIQGLSEQEPSWGSLVRGGLAIRLEELIRISLHSKLMRQHMLDNQSSSPSPAIEAGYIAAIQQSRDHKLTLFSAFSASIAILVVCTIWIESGWVYGAGAALGVTIACSFFATQDDPAPSIFKMLVMFVVIIIGVFVYVFGILPGVSVFESLYLALLPAGLIIGLLMTRPSTASAGMVLGAFGTTQLALQNGYSYDFITYAETSLSLLIGLSCALIVTRLMRSIGAAWSAERLMRANWRDVANAALATGAHDRATLTGLMMDRLGLMMSRLAAVEEGANSAAIDTLMDLRVGLNVIDLHREQWRLPPAARAACDKVFESISALYKNNPRHAPPPALCEAMDRSMDLLMQDAQAYRTALTMLSGLRLALYPHASPPAFFSPISPSVRA